MNISSGNLTTVIFAAEKIRCALRALLKGKMATTWASTTPYYTGCIVGFLFDPNINKDDVPGLPRRGITERQGELHAVGGNSTRLEGLTVATPPQRGAFLNGRSPPKRARLEGLGTQFV